MSLLQRRAAGLAASLAIAVLASACAAPPQHPPAALAIPPQEPAASARLPALHDLDGLKPKDVLSMLGKPDLERNEPPAELWQYRAPHCILNLFFYADADGYRLAHVETWQRTLSPAGDAPERCHDEESPIRKHLVTQSAL